MTPCVALHSSALDSDADYQILIAPGRAGGCCVGLC